MGIYFTASTLSSCCISSTKYFCISALMEVMESNRLLMNYMWSVLVFKLFSILFSDRNVLYMNIVYRYAFRSWRP